MNVNFVSKLPYLNTGDFDILLDTWSTINVISKSFVYKDKSRFEIFKEDFEFFTATGVTKGNEYVILIIGNEKVKCYLCNFHYKFNVLLGHEVLKQLKTSWNINEDLIRMGDRYFQLQYLQGSNIEASRKENHSMEVKKTGNSFESPEFPREE